GRPLRARPRHEGRRARDNTDDVSTPSRTERPNRAAHASSEPRTERSSKRSAATPPPTPPRSGEGRHFFSPFPPREGGRGVRVFPAPDRLLTCAACAALSAQGDALFATSGPLSSIRNPGFPLASSSNLRRVSRRCGVIRDAGATGKSGDSIETEEVGTFVEFASSSEPN